MTLYLDQQRVCEEPPSTGTVAIATTRSVSKCGGYHTSGAHGQDHCGQLATHGQISVACQSEMQGLDMRKISRYLIASLLLAATSCSAKSGLKITSDRQGSNMINETVITPEELGQRFLEMIKNTNDFKELTPNFIQESIGKQLTPDIDGKSGFYTLKLPNGDWQYSVTYNFDSSFTRNSNVSLKLIKSIEDADERSPPCQLDLDSYRTSIESAGFKPEPITYSEIGWIVALRYTRNNVLVQIIPHHLPSAAGRPARDCVNSLSIHKFGE